MALHHKLTANTQYQAGLYVYGKRVVATEPDPDSTGGRIYVTEDGSRYRDVWQTMWLYPARPRDC
jgi:hypothetical protein